MECRTKTWLEIRNPKSEIRKKPEIRNPKDLPRAADAAFGLRSSFGFQISDFRFHLRFHRKILLIFRFLSLLFPLLNARVPAAEREQLFFVVNHLLPRGAGERIIL